MAALQNELEFYNLTITTETEYGEVEYINSNRDAFALTNAIPGNTASIEIDFQINSFASNTSNYIFRTQSQDSNALLELAYDTQGNQWMLNIAGLGVLFKSGSYDTQRHLLKISWSEILLDNVALFSPGGPIVPVSSSITFFLFDYVSSVNIFGMKIFSSGSQVSNWIPDIRTFSGTDYWCMKDTYSGGYSSYSSSMIGYREEIEVKTSEYSKDLTIGNESIDSLKTVEAMSILGDELSYDTMAISAKQALELSFEDGEVIETYGEELKVYPYGSMVSHYIDSELKRKLFIENAERVGKRKYKYDCFSVIGLLDRQIYEGNLFQGKTAAQVFNEILAGSPLQYSVSQSIANVGIYGWLPYGTKRDALRQLLFALNAHAYADASQNILFKALDVSTVNGIPSSRIYENGTEEYVKKASKVVITEHSFVIIGDEEDTVLFDNSSSTAASSTLVVFSQSPIIPSSVSASSGLTIRKVSYNYAIVSGRGRLTGKPYTHLTQNIERISDDTHRADNEVTVTDATLVTAVNSENVADRVADYYFNRHVSKVDIKAQNERCGFAYSFVNAFGEETTGILHRMEKSYSSVVRASCEFICGLSIEESGNNYTHYVLITASGTWTPPSGTEKIRLTIIGGGTGGTSGLRGKDGEEHSGGSGGGAGLPGSAGRVKVVTIPVTSGSLTVTIGAGGSGGAVCDSELIVNTGSAGSSTTVSYAGTTYSSEDGTSPGSGVANTFTGDIYARPGETGASGGTGGSGATAGEEGSSGGSVAFGGQTYQGGSGGSSAAATSSASGRSYSSGGGGGGGACATGRGQNGANGSASQTSYIDDEMYKESDIATAGGKGGAGATPAKRSAATIYGSGGHAGHGGGGGGGNGRGTTAQYTSGDGVYIPLIIDAVYDNTPVVAGDGGNGGAGGDGAAGCVLIYY